MEKILIFVEVDPPLREPKVYRKLVRVPDLTGRHIVGVNDHDVDVLWPLQHICPVQCSPIVVEDPCEWSRYMAPEQVVPCHTHSRWPGGILGAETASAIEAVRSTVWGRWDPGVRGENLTSCTGMQRTGVQAECFPLYYNVCRRGKVVDAKVENTETAK
jgi:hypothetical protein